MDAHLDIDDVTAGHPIAEAELAELRSKADTLDALMKMRDKWEADERDHLMTFGQHLPASVVCMIEQFDAAISTPEKAE